MHEETTRVCLEPVTLNIIVNLSLNNLLLLFGCVISTSLNLPLTASVRLLPSNFTLIQHPPQSNRFNFNPTLFSFKSKSNLIQTYPHYDLSITVTAAVQQFKPRPCLS